MDIRNVLDTPKVCYECTVCGSVMTFNRDFNQEKIKCMCGSKEVKLLYTEIKQEELDNLSEELGKIYEGYMDTFNYYLDFPENLIKFLSIWCISTAIFEEFNTFPILFFNAMKGSAKSRTSRLVNYLAYMGTGKTTNNISESAFFRHQNNVPMSLDEVERIATKDLMGLRELINAVYKKGSTVKRIKRVREGKEEKFVEEVFENRFPMTIANINGLEEVLEDRGFTLILEMSNDPCFVNLTEDWEDRESIRVLKVRLSQFSAVMSMSLQKRHWKSDWNNFVKSYNNTNNNTTLTTLTTQTTIQQPPNNNNNNIIINNNEEIEKEQFFIKMYNSGITGRNFELAYPLLITAKLISDEVFEEILCIIKSYVDDKKDNAYIESRDVALFDFISRRESKLLEPIKQLTNEFRLFLGECEDWLNEKWFGRAIKRLGLIIDTKREASGRFVMLNNHKAKEKLMIFRKESK